MSIHCISLNPSKSNPLLRRITYIPEKSNPELSIYTTRCLPSIPHRFKYIPLHRPSPTLDPCPFPSRNLDQTATPNARSKGGRTKPSRQRIATHRTTEARRRRASKQASKRIPSKPHKRTLHSFASSFSSPTLSLGAYFFSTDSLWYWQPASALL